MQEIKNHGFRFPLFNFAYDAPADNAVDKFLLNPWWASFNFYLSCFFERRISF